MRKALTVLAVSFGLVLATAGPALAVSEEGTIYCAGYATARAQYTGDVYVLGPGDSSYDYFSGGTVASNRGNPDGYWRAFTNLGTLNGAGTYAYCNSAG